MTKRLVFGAGLAVICLSNAQADLFTFTYSDNFNPLNPDAAFGQLTATYDGSDTYSVTSGFMTVLSGFDGPPNTTYALFANPNDPNQALSPSGYFTYDDLLKSANPVVDNAGLLFTNGAGLEINIFSNGPGDSYQIYDNHGQTNGDAHGRFNIVPFPSPEPFTLCLGGAGLVLAARRRLKTRRAV